VTAKSRPNFPLQGATVHAGAADEVARRRRRGVVLRAPRDDFQQDREEVDALRGQAVATRSSLVVTFDNAVAFEPGQAIGQDVGRDPFLRSQELRVGRPALEHQVADDEQRPRVAENLEREVDRAVRPPPGLAHTDASPTPCRALSVNMNLQNTSDRCHVNLQNASA